MVKSTEFSYQNITIESLLPSLTFQWFFFLLQSKKKQLLFFNRHTACVVRPCRNYWRMKIAMNTGFSSDQPNTSEVNLSSAPPYCLHLPEQVWHELDLFRRKLTWNTHCRKVLKLLQLVLGIQNTGRSQRWSNIWDIPILCQYQILSTQVFLYICALQNYYLHYWKHNQEMKYINLVLIHKPHQKYIPALLHVTDTLTDSCQIQGFSII